MKKWVLLLAAAVLAPGAAWADPVRVTITNLQPADGVFLTPVFFATHNGMFGQFDPGAPASVGVERIAEDGNTGPHIAAALASGHVFQAMATAGGPIAPGQSRTVVLDVDRSNPLTPFLRFLSMV